MVRVLQAYNFHKQKTFPISGDILAACLIDKNRIAISSAEQFIEIYNISESYNDECQSNDVPKSTAKDYDAGETIRADFGLMKYSLATVGEVVNMIYCEAGKYLLTLEKDNVGSPLHSNSTSISCTSSNNGAGTISEEDVKLFVRIYTNFLKFPESKLIDCPITIRIASMTTPKAAMVESIDVIELPLRSPPDLIQCCQTSGNIIVSSKERIYLYEFTQCTHEGTQPRYTYIDFLPFKFFVNLNFLPQKICLAENVIACMNSRYCVAFKIVDIPSASSGPCGLGDFCGRDENNEDGDEVGEPTCDSSPSIVSRASAVPSSFNSFESDSLETTCSRVGVSGFPGRTTIDFNVARIVNSACGRDFEVDLKSLWERNEPAMGTDHACSDVQEIVIYPARANEIKIKLVNEAKAMNVSRITNHGSISSSHCADASVQYDIKKLLQICIKTAEPNSRVLEILRCMDLKAMYRRVAVGNVGNDDDDNEVNDENIGNQQTVDPPGSSSYKSAQRRTLKSSQHQYCVGYSLLVATSVDGYLYQFCAQGKWYNENEKPIALYSFTAPVIKVHINDYVIYAITTESMEVHTSRIGHKLFYNRFEYPTVGDMLPEESSPDVNAAVAVIGLFSFMHVQFVCVNRDNLVLISNSTNNLSTTIPNSINSQEANTRKRRTGGIAARFLAEARHLQFRSGHANSAPIAAVNEWTVYNLAIPEVSTIIDDLEMLAETFRTASAANFFDLMEEAHVILRLSLSLEFAPLSKEEARKLHAKFTENCRKLADFSIRSQKKEVFLQATGFYKMCDLQLPEIYANFISNHLTSKEDEYKTSPDGCGFQGNAKDLIGLIYTVKTFLISLGTDRRKATFLNHLVKPYFTRNNYTQPRSEQQKRLPHVPLALEFLNMFIQFSPFDIPQIMLSSPVLADIVSEQLMAYLKEMDKRSSEESLLLAVCACRMSKYFISSDVIAELTRRDLAVALIKNKNVLFDDGTLLYLRHPRETTALRFDTMPTGSYNATRRSRNTANPVSATSCPPTASFSDFSETILMTTERPDHIEAISDAFIHALCIERSVGLEMMIYLFLNYIATHIGHKGYHTSQKIFLNVLQVYYYDLFDVNPLGSVDLRSNTSPLVEVDNEEEEDEEASSNTVSLYGDSEPDIGSASSEASSSLEEQRYHHHHQHRSDIKRNRLISHRSSNISLSLEQINDGEIILRGLKILFRMYLGRLKALSEIFESEEKVDADRSPPPKCVDFLQLRLECIRFLARYMQELKLQNQTTPSSRYFNGSRKQSKGCGGGGSNDRRDGGHKFVFVPLIPDYKVVDDVENNLNQYVRPIPCLKDRPQYLNRLPPFKRTDFSQPEKDNGSGNVQFVAWQNELLGLTLKIQSLLSSPKIDHEIIEEFVAFIQKSPNLIGIDSFLVIILPKNLAINYILHFRPEYIWQYGKSNNFSPKHWEYLLKKILSKQSILPNWKTYITDILNNLVTELTFEELLQCFPSEVVRNRNTKVFFKKSDIRCAYDQEQQPLLDKLLEQNERNDGYPPRNHSAMDNIDENNVFEVVLRKAVSKQRSLALRSMIESTGTQLFEATNNPMYNLN